MGRMPRRLWSKRGKRAGHADEEIGIGMARCEGHANAACGVDSFHRCSV